MRRVSVWKAGKVVEMTVGGHNEQEGKVSLSMALVNLLQEGDSFQLRTACGPSQRCGRRQVSLCPSHQRSVAPVKPESWERPE